MGTETCDSPTAVFTVSFSSGLSRSGKVSGVGGKERNEKVC